jgi:hypothetical protein
MKDYNVEDYKLKICPKCNSKRISQINTYQVWTEVNTSSGRILKNSKKLTPYSRVFHNYICRKCGWQSENFDE